MKSIGLQPGLAPLPLIHVFQRLNKYRYQGLFKKEGIMKKKRFELANIELRSFILVGTNLKAKKGAEGQDTYDGHNCLGSCPIVTVCDPTTWTYTD